MHGKIRHHQGKATNDRYIMGLRKSYERREISEIRWINGEDNPADSMTKINANKSLQKLIDYNEIVIRLQG